MKKFFFAASALSLLILLFGYFQKSSSLTNASLDYFYINCSIYNRDGKLIFHSAEALCAFSDSGMRLSSDPEGSKFYFRDRADNLLWETDENIHHDLKFTADQHEFLAINSAVTEFQGKQVRADCVSRRNLKNEIQLKWCLGDHIGELEKAGLKFALKPLTVNTFSKVHGLEFEISHTNSIYEMGKNAAADKNAAFSEGNYVVNLHSPSRGIVVLDREMKNILWVGNMKKFRGPEAVMTVWSHDVQMGEDGKFLIYANKIFFSKDTEEENEKNTHSSLLKYDPVTEKIELIYEAQPKESFNSPALGSVTLLANGHYLINDHTTERPAALEVGEGGKVFWKFEPALPARERWPPIYKLKPLKNVSFLLTRSLIGDQ